MELEDDYCLHDYSIHDGATLKLVLAMRGGPINTRRSEIIYLFTVTLILTTLIALQQTIVESILKEREIDFSCIVFI